MKHTPISSLHFYGDSLTAGYGAAPADGWIARLSPRFPALSLYNHGACGAGLSDLLAETGYLLTYPAPGDTVFFMAGTNDLLCGRRFDALVREAESGLTALSEKLPLLLGTPPLTTKASITTGWQAEWRYDATNDALTRYADFLRTLAARLSLPLIDFAAALPQDDRYYEDGVHPNAAGYKIFADTAEKVLAALLPWRKEKNAPWQKDVRR